MARKVIALKDALVGKSEQFRTNEAVQARAASDFIEASARAQNESLENARQAKAVEEAVRILNEAGVEI